MITLVCVLVTCVLVVWAMLECTAVQPWEGSEVEHGTWEEIPPPRPHHAPFVGACYPMGYTPRRGRRPAARCISAARATYISGGVGNSRAGPALPTSRAMCASKSHATYIGDPLPTPV